MPLIKQTLITTKTFFVRLVNCPSGSPSDLYPYAGCFPVKRSVGLTFVYVMICILIIIHLLEVFALVKLASLKGDFSAWFCCSLSGSACFFELADFFTTILLFRPWSRGYAA
jgi:hypothetical protein